MEHGTASIQPGFQVLSLLKGGEVRKSPDPPPAQLSLISKAFPRWELPRQWKGAEEKEPRAWGMLSLTDGP